MNYLFIIFLLGMNSSNSFFYSFPKIKLLKSKIINCNQNYGTEYDLEMDKDELFFHSLNLNYTKTNDTISLNQNIVLLNSHLPLF
jgi:hypothetical protein